MGFGRPKIGFKNWLQKAKIGFRGPKLAAPKLALEGPTWRQKTQLASVRRANLASEGPNWFQKPKLGFRRPKLAAEIGFRR